MGTVSVTAPQRRTPAWFGLFLSLFGMLLIRGAFLHFSANPRAPHVILARECCYFALAISLLLLVRIGEKRPLSAIGIGTSVWWKTLCWGVLTAAMCFAAAGTVVHFTGYHGEAAGTGFDLLPTWLVFLNVLRAGIVEEICYRGYAMEKLKEAGLGRVWVFLLPLIIFCSGHYSLGRIGVLLALLLGAILAAMYQWRRDLNANILAHFLVDFISDILPRLLH
jgi:uncharacterized protein